MSNKQQALADVRAAVQNPVLQFGVDYYQLNGSLTHLPVLKNTLQTFSAAATLNFREGKGQEGKENLQAAVDLTRFYDERTLISQLVRYAMVAIAWRNNWEALLRMPKWRKRGASNP